MSTGNANSNGNKGVNMPFQLNVLKGLQKVSDNTNNLGGVLTSLLNAIRDHQDMEILLIRDTGNADIIVQQIREYDETLQTWSTYYQDISGAPYVPVGPLEYLDASAVLALILAELLDQGLTLDSVLTNTTSIAAEDFATQTTLLALLTAFNAEDFATQTTLLALLTAFNAEDFASQTTLAALLTAFNAEDFATQTTLLTRLSKADFEARINTLGQKLMAASTPVVIASDQSAIPVTIGGGGANTSFYNRNVGSGLVVPLGAKSISVQNIGNDNITMITDSSPSTIIDPGVSLTFDAEISKTLGAFTFTHSSVSSLYIVTQVR